MLRSVNGKVEEEHAEVVWARNEGESGKFIVMSAEIYMTKCEANTLYMMRGTR